MNASSNQGYARIMATSVRHVVINWVTLKPLFRFLFRFQTVLVLLITFEIIHLLDAVVTFSEMRSDFDDLFDMRPVRNVLAVLGPIFWAALGFILLRHLSKAKGVTGLEELTLARKKGLLSEAEFRAKSWVIEMEQAVENLRGLKARGLLSGEELRNLEALTRSRFQELIFFESLKSAKSSGVINSREFKERVEKFAIKPEESFGEAVMAAAGTLAGPKKSPDAKNDDDE